MDGWMDMSYYRLLFLSKTALRSLIEMQRFLNGCLKNFDQFHT